jgi:nucleoside 2-deoxyribosyltransferase
MKIYFAAPLFNEMERERNEKAKKQLTDAGFEVFLPQEAGGKAADEGGGPEIRAHIFKTDVGGMNWAEAGVFYLEGAHCDEGTCMELGYTFAQGKKVFIVSDDSRVFAQNAPFNLMLSEAAEKIFKSTEDLISYLKLTYPTPFPRPHFAI